MHLTVFFKVYLLFAGAGRLPRWLNRLNDIYHWFRMDAIFSFSFFLMKKFIYQKYYYFTSGFMIRASHPPASSPLAPKWFLPNVFKVIQPNLNSGSPRSPEYHPNIDRIIRKLYIHLRLVIVKYALTPPTVTPALIQVSFLSPLETKRG